MITYNDPDCYAACPTCGAGDHERCWSLTDTVNRRRTSRVIHPGRPRGDWAPPLRPGRTVDEELRDHRLKVWRKRARLGDPIADIAAELGMKRAALDQYVQRARKDGHPDAVYHRHARPDVPLNLRHRRTRHTT